MKGEKCPNVSSKEWKLLVSKVGETESYKIWLANGEEIPSIEEINKIKITKKVLENPVNWFPIAHKNLNKLESGEKRISVRPNLYIQGVYKFGKSYYRVSKLYDDKVNIDAVKDKELLRKNFIQEDAIEYSHIQNFFDGKNSMYVYQIQKIDNTITNLTKERIVNKEQPKESAFLAQELYFKKRVKELTLQLKKYKEGTEKYIEIKTELVTLKQKLDVAIETQNRALFTEMGQETLDRAKEYINELESFSEEFEDPERFAETVEYIKTVVDLWRDDEDLASESIKLRKRLFPFIQKNNLVLINKYSTKPNGVTQEEVDAQNKDIDSLKKTWGALVDVPNYIVGTIGAMIKSTQNSVETEDKLSQKTIQSSVDIFLEWGKKNEAKTKDLYSIFIQESKGDITLAKRFLENGDINPNWRKIQDTPELKQFYDLYTKLVTEAQDKAGLQGLSKYFIPNVKTKSLKNTIGKLNPIKTIEYGNFNKSEELLSDVVPYQFLKPIPIAEKSTDLGNSLLEFVAFANNYEQMSKILPQARLLQEQIAYKQLEGGEVKQRDYVKSSGTKTIHGEDTNLYKMSAIVIEMQIKGKMKLEQGQLKIEDVTDAEGNIIGHKYIDATQIADGFLQYNSLLRIGLSPIGSVTNAIVGDAGSIIEAVGGRYFTLNGLRWASNIFMKQNLKEDSELNKWLTKLNPLQELESYEEIKDGVTPTLGKLSVDKFKEFMFAPQKWGEKWIQARIMTAILIKDGYMDRKGNTTPKGENITKEELAKLADKVHFVIDSTQGRYSAKDAATAQRHILYRMLIQFRKFIPAMYESRMDEYNPHSNRAGFSTEGRYRTIARSVFKPLIKGQFQEAFSNMILPLINQKKALESGKLTELEIYNMRKNAAELLMILGVMLMYGGLRGGDDDKDKKWRKRPDVKLALSLLNRAGGDLEFFWNPSQLNNLGKNALPIAKTFGDIITTFNNIPAIFYGEDSQFKSGSRKGENRFYNNALRLVPGVKLIPEIKRYASDSPLEELNK